MLLNIKLIKQDNAGHSFIYFFLTNKTKTNTHTHTHIYTKKDKKRKRDEITRSRPLPFHFEQSINQSYDQWDAISLIT